MQAAEPKPPSEASAEPETAETANPHRHLAVEQAKRNFGDFVALDIEKLSIGRGHVAVIIGGSGAGKTTLLKILIGLDRPNSGAVYVDGVDITKLSDRKLNEVRRKLGMVFQYSALLDSMNVLDNVAFPLREHTQLKHKEIRDKVIEKLKTLGLENIELRMPSELSGGMRKRVALARALMLEPQVILYDEPTSGLDPITSRMVDDLILETRERFGVTSVVISHDMTGAMLIADEIHVLAKGKLVASGTPQELVDSDQELIQKFLECSGIEAEKLMGKRTQRPKDSR